MTVEDLIRGLEILCKHSSKGQASYVEAQHDIILLDPSIAANLPSEEDLKELDSIGWFYDSDDYHCWCHFT